MRFDEIDHLPPFVNIIINAVHLIERAESGVNPPPKNRARQHWKFFCHITPHAIGHFEQIEFPRGKCRPHDRTPSDIVIIFADVAARHPPARNESFIRRGDVLKQFAFGITNRVENVSAIEFCPSGSIHVAMIKHFANALLRRQTLFAPIAQNFFPIVEHNRVTAQRHVDAEFFYQSEQIFNHIGLNGIVAVDKRNEIAARAFDADISSVG